MKTHSFLNPKVIKTPITALVFSDDKKLLSFSTEGDYLTGNYIFIYEFETRKKIIQIHSKNFQPIKFLLFIPDTCFLAYISGQQLNIYNFATDQILHQLDLPEKPQSISIIQSNIAISFISGVTILSSNTYERISFDELFEKMIYIRGFNDTYVGINAKGQLVMEHLKNRKTVHFNTPILCTSTSLSSNRNIISGSCYSGTGFFLFNANTREELNLNNLLKTIKVPVWDINSSEELLALGSDTGLLNLIDLTTSEVLVFTPLHKGPLTSINFIAERLISSGLDGRILINEL